MEAAAGRFYAPITRADAKALFTELSVKGLSVGHQKKIKIILNRMHAFAADEGMMPEGINPFRAVEFPKEEEKVPEILSIEEIRLLLKAARDMDHPRYPVWAMAPPESPTPLEKFRFDLQQKFVLHKLRSKISQREMAKILGIDEAKVSKILRNRLDDFSTDRLITLYEKINPDVTLKVS